MSVFAAVLAVGVLAACSSTGLATLPSSSPTHSANPFELTASQKRMATKIALREAAGASPSDPGIVQPISAHSWPSYVQSVEAIANLSEADAGKYMGEGTTSDTAVIVIRMTGHFVSVHSAPVGASPITAGTALSVEINARNGQFIGFGIGSDDAIPELPNPEVIYSREPH
jgi:hypothetical protein